MTEPKVGDYLFTYGTLRPGCRAYGMIQGGTELLGRSTLPQAALYSLGGFPGLKLGRDSTVIGALLEVTDASVFTTLDRYEGHPEFYTRELLETMDGPAWVYVYQGDVKEDSRIMSGDWINRGSTA